jgi:D-alanyl-lipoteichoic acid acyltransferase DltB (MBOAT superfamily)
MAIGLSLMFNVRLPMNFNSPYKSTSIIEFWRRWHMTLSRFLRDYLYIPLGGNRKGSSRRYLNLMITMLLGGLWHGAGWTFVVWGGLHGLYLMVNYAWRSLKQRMSWTGIGRWGNLGAGILTFLAVVVGWVFFRAENFSTAVDLLRGMLGLNGITFSKGLGNTGLASIMRNYGAEFFGAMHLTNLDAFRAIKILVPGMFVVFMLPNVQQIMANFETVLDSPNKPGEKQTGLVWQSSLLGVFMMMMIGFLVIINLHKQSAFLYFQF